MVLDKENSLLGKIDKNIGHNSVENKKSSIVITGNTSSSKDDFYWDNIFDESFLKDFVDKNGNLIA